MSLRKRLRNSPKDSLPRVRRLEDEDGRVVWIKRAALPKATFWHDIQHLAARLVPMPILRPTVCRGGADSLAEEAQRLLSLRGAGFHAPEVLARGEDGSLTLSDAGPSLKTVLDRMEEPKAREALLTRAVETLAALHAAGIVHGRPYLRDMVLRESDGAVGFLDLEEDPLAALPPADARARDIWIFLCSAARYAGAEPALVDRLYAAFREKSDGGREAALKGLIRFLSPLARLLRAPFLLPRLGKDVRQAILVNERLSGILLRKS